MADLALYRARSAGRNGYCFFDPQMSAIASERQGIENDLRRAIQQNEFELHYQPIIVQVGKGLRCGGVRPLAASGQGSDLSRLVYSGGRRNRPGHADRRLGVAHGVRPGRKVAHEVKLAVILSVIQFQKPNFAELAMQVLAESGLSPKRLKLEITETALIESAAQCLPRQFKSLGITIVLDDFGTEYSSLSQFAMFPFDKIKIDKSFTQNLTKRSECAAIICATLALAQNLDIATTTEGVETNDQYRILRLAGVTSVQGYLFKRAVPAPELDFGSMCGAVVENAA